MPALSKHVHKHWTQWRHLQAVIPSHVPHLNSPNLSSLSFVPSLHHPVLRLRLCRLQLQGTAGRAPLKVLVVEQGLAAGADVVAGLSDIPHRPNSSPAASAHSRLPFTALTITKENNPALFKYHTQLDIWTKHTPNVFMFNPTLILEKLLSTRKRARVLPPPSLSVCISIASRHTTRDHWGNRTHKKCSWLIHQWHKQVNY